MAAPLLVSDRFELWQPQVGDQHGLFDLTFDEETRRFLGSFLPTETDAFSRLQRNAGSWALYGYGVFMVRRPGDERIIATCGVFRSHRGFGPDKGMDDVAEAGWIVHKDFWGQGVASEVMRAALDWFDAVHGRQRIACMIDEGNAASDAIARKLGFVKYGRHDMTEGSTVRLYERL
ncbi:MAG: GNAT family N-acetyltransferase [Novosphingobium sp.]